MVGGGGDEIRNCREIKCVESKTEVPLKVSKNK
jgi:hypothetical protein